MLLSIAAISIIRKKGPPQNRTSHQKLYTAKKDLLVSSLVVEVDSGGIWRRSGAVVIQGLASASAEMDLTDIYPQRSVDAQPAAHETGNFCHTSRRIRYQLALD